MLMGARTWDGWTRLPTAAHQTRPLRQPAEPPQSGKRNIALSRLTANNNPNIFPVISQPPPSTPSSIYHTHTIHTICQRLRMSRSSSFGNCTLDSRRHIWRTTRHSGSCSTTSRPRDTASPTYRCSPCWARVEVGHVSVHLSHTHMYARTHTHAHKHSHAMPEGSQTEVGVCVCMCVVRVCALSLCISLLHTRTHAHIHMYINRESAHTRAHHTHTHTHTHTHLPLSGCPRAWPAGQSRASRPPSRRPQPCSAALPWTGL